MDNPEILNKFYKAFQQRDYATMQSCYHEDVQFSDPAFQNLNAKQVKAMWHMLCERGKDLVVEFDLINENQVFWKANYSFSKTGRKVENRITASFQLKEGLIYRHNDQFNLWKWSGMALGTAGVLLGWTPFMKSKIRKMAMSGLYHFVKTHPEYQ